MLATGSLLAAALLPLLLLLLIALTATDAAGTLEKKSIGAAAVPTKTRPCRTGKHHGPEGRTESKIYVSRGLLQKACYIYVSRGWLATKKCIRLPKSEYNVVAWCREPVDFFVESFFFLGSNEFIPPSGFLFQQKVIAKLSLRLSLNWNCWRSRKERKRECRTKKIIEKKGERKE